SDTLSWVGMSMDPGLTPDRQWHRGLAFTNVFRGTIRSDRTIAGEWSDVPRGSSLHNGTLTVRFDADRTIVRLTKVAGTGPFGATSWIKIDPIDDTMFEKAPADIISRFDRVRKNDGGAIHDNLKPYRDQTVLYGRLMTQHLDYTNDNMLEHEIPHINYGPPFRLEIPAFPNFGLRDRSFDTFCAPVDDGDGDFDLRLKVDMNRL